MDRRVVVLDRDGTINKDLGRHVTAWEEFEFLPGALDAIRMIAERGFLVAIASNQSGVEAGTLSANALDHIHNNMVRAIVEHGGRIDAFRYCPHTPFTRCMCRKPRPGMLLDIARELAVGPESLIMVGDCLRDVEAAEAIGARGALVASGHALPAERMQHDGYGNSWVQVGNVLRQTVPVYRNLEEFALCLM